MRVLLVEDEVRLADTIKRGLVDHGFVVDVAHDGNEGLWLATEKTFDAIILDIMLPGMNGYDVLKGIRQHRVWAPVLMLTAKDGEFDQVDAFDLGADDYLTKPFSFIVLLARVRALIRRGAPERPMIMQAGDLSLDPTTHRVTRAGADVTLTPKEFALLQFFMQHPGEAMTKSHILDNVWDAAYDGDLNVVEVYVRYLRLKLDVPFGRHALETIRGVGYRLDPAGG
ncbi:DNA-binding response regulator [Aeromicrobium sp. A1-2]|uniref:response regulator transcription factor n=1 Tax=Aeromicrobium sp. A1-2 TaxID=2107713 RepID=UPI000E4A04C9|nr:response regulator transcription factor [Aeromicrobium sp. A1-2]AXT84650.1 DNA-binding response regulator [Aeromicrobium sp. A1-2]